jgi:hypothetical protein
MTGSSKPINSLRGEMMGFASLYPSYKMIDRTKFEQHLPLI